MKLLDIELIKTPRYQEWLEKVKTEDPGVWREHVEANERSIAEAEVLTKQRARNEHLD
ncbi:hypothetical protein CA54_16570 [Symmachiella macrocystis]|uniref:Uncharacterized protein n=1 Tax=Symmachiella macrocystis TaxID=2527985 RepID=A0A5C6BN31_9PLAN|nr:hypothetical protein [Symmachiella macrocystis]TWU12831.1 hypothetical protein CA54_16570 [Symmachiella macrocystis]